MANSEQSQLEDVYQRLAELSAEIRAVRESSLLRWEEALRAGQLYRELSALNRTLLRSDIGKVP